MHCNKFVLFSIITKGDLLCSSSFSYLLLKWQMVILIVVKAANDETAGNHSEPLDVRWFPFFIYLVHFDIRYKVFLNVNPDPGTQSHL